MKTHRVPPDLEALIAQYAQHPGDTGSGPVQVAVLSARIDLITRHLRAAQRDYYSRRGLLALVAKRRRLLLALAQRDPAGTAELARSLGIVMALPTEEEEA